MYTICDTQQRIYLYYISKGFFILIEYSLSVYLLNNKRLSLNCEWKKSYGFLCIPRLSIQSEPPRQNCDSWHRDIAFGFQFAIINSIIHTVIVLLKSENRIVCTVALQVFLSVPIYDIDAYNVPKIMSVKKKHGETTVWTFL